MRWVALHFAELQYSVGLIPASAFIVLLGLAWKRGASTTPAERAFLAVAMAATLWFVLEVAAFASRYSQRIEERNMFYLAPLLFLALAVWLDKGLPRPTGLTAAAAVIPAGMLVLLPIEGLLNVSIMSDTFAFVPLLRVSNVFDGGTTDMRILLGLGAVAVALVFACLPRRLAMFAIPLGMAAFLALSSYSVLGSVRTQSLGALASQGVRSEGRELGRRPRRDRRPRRLRQQHLARGKPAHALADRVLEPQHRVGRGPGRAAAHHARARGRDRPADRADRHQRPVRGSVGPDVSRTRSPRPRSSSRDR